MCSYPVGFGRATHSLVHCSSVFVRVGGRVARLDVPGGCCKGPYVVPVQSLIATRIAAGVCVLTVCCQRRKHAQGVNPGSSGSAQTAPWSNSASNYQSALGQSVFHSALAQSVYAAHGTKAAVASMRSALPCLASLSVFARAGWAAQLTKDAGYPCTRRELGGRGHCVPPSAVVARQLPGRCGG